MLRQVELRCLMRCRIRKQSLRMSISEMHHIPVYNRQSRCQRRRNTVSASVFRSEVGLENNPASRRRVPVKRQEIPLRTLLPSQDRTQTSNASIVRDVRDFQLRLGIGHMVPLVCDLVVPREKRVPAIRSRGYQASMQMTNSRSSSNAAKLVILVLR